VRAGRGSGSERAAADCPGAAAERNEDADEEDERD
jgi:hypothetical protein